MKPKLLKKQTAPAATLLFAEEQELLAGAPHLEAERIRKIAAASGRRLYPVEQKKEGTDGTQDN